MFNMCNKITTVYLPSTIQAIEGNAFSNSGAMTINFAGSVSEWNSITIAENTLRANTTIVCTDGNIVIN